MRRFALFLAASAAALSGCAAQAPARALMGKTPSPATYGKATATQLALRDLPAPERPVAVAVYSFTDQTGQFRPSDTGQTLSRAVSQGGGAMLMRALHDAGARSWFTVIEREQVSHLLQERQIIREMRERYLGERDVNPQALPALLFAGVILEGGIIGYDSNTLTGGAGAAFLGVGARTQYRQDTVTVYLRAVSTRTGEVLTTTTASKTIASVQLQGSAFRYVGFRELLEAETGITTNEPDQLALQQAIEKAVYGLVMEGSDLGLWKFRDQAAAWPSIYRYRQERDGHLDAAEVERAAAKGRKRDGKGQKASVEAPPMPPLTGDASGRQAAAPASRQVFAADVAAPIVLAAQQRPAAVAPVAAAPAPVAPPSVRPQAGGPTAPGPVVGPVGAPPRMAAAGVTQPIVIRAAAATPPAQGAAPVAAKAAAPAPVRLPAAAAGGTGQPATVAIQPSAKPAAAPALAAVAPAPSKPSSSAPAVTSVLTPAAAVTPAQPVTMRPIVHRRDAPAPARPTLVRAASAPGAGARTRLHTVAPGETLLGLANRYRVSGAALARLNGLAWDAQIAAGDTLRVPLTVAQGG